MPEIEKFEMTCQRIFVIVLILVMIPVFMMGIFFALILNFHDLPDWILIPAIILNMGLIFFMVYKALKNWTNIPCEVYLSLEKIKIKLQRPSFIFSKTEYESNWDQLLNVSSNYEPRSSQRFYKISFSDPSITISLDAKQKVLPGEETEFGTLLLNYVEMENAKNITKPKIDTTNFYQGKGALILTGFTWIFLIAICIVYLISDKIDAWRIVQFTAFASIWLSAYYFNRKKKDKGGANIDES